MKLHVVHAVPVTENFCEVEECVTDNGKMFHLEISPAEACILLHEIGNNPRYEMSHTLMAMIGMALVTCSDDEVMCRCRHCQNEYPRELPPLHIGTVKTPTQAELRRLLAE